MFKDTIFSNISMIHIHPEHISISFNVFIYVLSTSVTLGWLVTSWVAKTKVTAHVLMIRRLMGYVASMYTMYTHICTVSELHHEFMNMMCAKYIYIASIYVRNYVYTQKKSLYPVCMRFVYIYINTAHNYVMALQMFLHLSEMNLPWILSRPVVTGISKSRC